MTIEENVLYTAISGMHDPVVILKAEKDNNDNITDFICSYINLSAAKELNVLKEEISGQKLSVFAPRMGRSKLFHAYAKVILSGEPCTLDISNPGVNSHGQLSRNLFEIRISRILSDSCIITWRDVTEKRQLEKALKRSEETFRLALKHSKITVLRMNTDFNITWIYNPHPDFKPEKALGNKAYEIIGEKAARSFHQKLSSAIDSRKQIRFEQRMTVYDKLLDFEILAEPSYNSRGKISGLFVVALDITVRKAMELRLRQAMKKLAASNEDLEQFAFIASHDLQEPLRIIKSYSRILSEKFSGALTGDALQYLEFITGSANRLHLMIQDLLEYSRITTKARPFEKVNLNKTLEDVLSDLQFIIREKRAEITIEELPEINADPFQIHRLFQNLLSNALKFCDKDHPVVHLSVKAKRTLIVFCVKDNGIGIESRFYRRIFMIFQRLHEQKAYSGTGIGLAMCKKIVERHKGRIWLKSRPGEGTEFYVALHSKSNAAEKPRVKV